MTFDLSNVGVSSMAWEPKEDSHVSEALSSFGICNVDLTPSKYFSWDAHNAVSLAQELREFWESRNFRIRGIQSLLFGVPKWNILDPSDWNSLFSHFEKVFNITEALGARFLVFGSPSNRRAEGLSKHEAVEVAEGFFREIANRMQGRDLELTIEANPERYGCDFITSTSQSAELVKRIASPNISSQLDLGTCMINSEKLEELSVYAGNFGYVHLSTIDLLPLHLEPNPLVLEYLSEPISGRKITIEQKSPLGEGAQSISKTLQWLAKGLYDQEGASN